jgi:hypothetical protein
VIECEVWIDIECPIGEQREVACTVFSRQLFPVRPLVGEHLSFQPTKDPKHAFGLAMAWGPMHANHASSEIEEISHYRGPKSERLEFRTSLRCSRIAVHSVQDARSLVAFLVSEHGFEIDPYGSNKLSEGESAA